MPRPGETHAEWLERMRSVGVVSKLSGNKVKEFRDDNGHRVKMTKDDATTRGNLVTEKAADNSQHVLIRPDTVHASRGDFQ